MACEGLRDRHGREAALCGRQPIEGTLAGAPRTSTESGAAQLVAGTANRHAVAVGPPHPAKPTITRFQRSSTPGGGWIISPGGAVAALVRRIARGGTTAAGPRP